MGLQVASTSVSSSSASKNVILRKYIGQENITGSLKNIKNCIIQREKGNLNYSSIKITDSTNTRGILKQEVQQIRDLKLLSNVSVQSNMAPALTEPLSPANKLSSSATSASPRPISNSQFAVNGNNYLSSSTQNFNGDTKNLIDIETELLRITTKGDINGGNNFCSDSNIGGGVINKAKTVAEIHKNKNIFKGDSIKFSKGAFQSVFEEVVAKQKEEAAAVVSENTTLPKLSIDCISSLSDIKQSKNYKLRQPIEKKTNRFLTIPLKRLNISREKFSRQMGPMCDTNNLAKSQQLEITGGSGDIENQQETDKKETKNNNYSTSRDSVGGADSGEVPVQQIKVEESEEHMDLSNYDNNEDSQQENAQVEINSSSSTVTAENTDAEDNTPFPDDIIINNENLPDQHTIVTQESFETLQRTPPLTVTSNVVGSGGTNQQQFLELQQQQSQQSQTVTTTPICSLTPQSTTSIGGLSSQRDFIKDSVEMDQVLGDMDLLQVLKGFDAAPGTENLCDLAGSLGLFNDVDVMNNYEEMGTPVKDSETREIRSEIERRQQQMQRKCDFLLRRLRKIQARYMGRHTSEEVVGLFEWTNRLVRRKGREQNREILYEEDKRRPVSTESMRSFLKRLDTAATSQHSIHCKSSQETATTPPTTTVSGQTAAFYSGVSTNVNSSNNTTDMPLIISTYDEKTTKDIEHVSGMLQIEMKEVQSGFDSDVTVSSSGGESADEMVTYNNQVQQSLSIAKRAAWRWARDRAAIAARWSWLLAQISDLEYRIRQHNELHHQIKKNKGAVTFEKVTELLAISPSSSSLSPPSLSTSVVIDQQQQLTSVNGYRGTLPGNSKAFDIDVNNPPNGVCESNNLPGACRTRPFQRAGFRKRKLLQTANVHTISKKAARPSTIKCGCQWPLHPCALCTGRSDPTAPRDLPDTMKFSERVALLDSGFHAVLSFPEDVSSSIHLEAKMRLSEWQNRMMRSPSSSSSSKNSKGVGITTIPQQKVVERGEDRSSNKKLMDSRRKQNRKYAQDSGQAANKMKNSKARQALLNNQFNNSHPYTKSNNKYRKLSLNAGLISGIGTSEYQEGITGSIGTNSSGVTGSLDGGIDGNDYANNHHIPRSKNSSPTHGNHSSTSHKYESRFDRKNRNSYDIDNIVIPYSVAAATRVEILPYKEIPTPKWRIIKDDDLVEQEKVSEDNEHEDISDLAIQIRHERALLEERKKFQTYLKFPWSTRSRANRRIDSRAESSGANTPDPTSPASNTTNVIGDQESIPSPANPPTPQTPAESVEGGSDNHATLQNPITTFLNSSHRRGERRRTTSSKKDTGKEEQRRSSSPDGRDIIPPFEPLEFPLSDEKYETMLRIMPSNHHLLLEDCSKVNCDQSTDKTDEKSEDYNNDGGEGVCGNGINDGSIESESSSSNKREYSTDLSKTTTSTATHMKTMVNSDDLLSAFDTGDSLMGCDSDTDSAESGLQDEDPNDPEWREPA